MNPEEGSDIPEFSEAKKSRSRFLSTLGHELRTPLGSVLMLAEMLADGDSSAAGEARRIHRAAVDMQELIEQVSRLARIEGGRIEPHWEELSGAAVATALEKRFAARDPRVRVETRPGLPCSLTTDLELVLEVVGRLLSAEAESTVVLGHDPRSRDGLVIRVRRPAPGLRAADLIYLFEPFHPAARIFRRRHGGQSLDPAVAQALTVLLGGTVSAILLPGEGLEVALHLA